MQHKWAQRRELPMTEVQQAYLDPLKHSHDLLWLSMHCCQAHVAQAGAERASRPPILDTVLAQGFMHVLHAQVGMYALFVGELYAWFVVGKAPRTLAELVWPPAATVKPWKMTSRLFAALLWQMTLSNCFCSAQGQHPLMQSLLLQQAKLHVIVCICLQVRLWVGASPSRGTRSEELHQRGVSSDSLDSPFIHLLEGS